MAVIGVRLFECRSQEAKMKVLTLCVVMIFMVLSGCAGSIRGRAGRACGRDGASGDDRKKRHDGHGEKQSLHLELLKIVTVWWNY